MKFIAWVILVLCTAMTLVNLYQIHAKVPGDIKYLNVVVDSILVVIYIWILVRLYTNE